MDSLRTISVIKACDPTPDEIIVHVDGGARDVAQAITEAHPDVKVLVSESFVGPGGGRNILVKAARNNWVVNFDDDSEPVKSDYFTRVQSVMLRFPDCAVISAASQEWERQTLGFMRFGIFSGCGCVFNKRWFLRTRGFVPLRIAYCMEEVDLSLQLYEIGGLIVHDPRLHVRHRKELPNSVPIEVHAHVLSNVALMPLLRYPLALLPLTLLHVMTRVMQMIRLGHWHALVWGLALIPCQSLRYLGYRHAVSINSLLQWRELCRIPECLGFERADNDFCS